MRCNRKLVIMDLATPVLNGLDATAQSPGSDILLRVSSYSRGNLRRFRPFNRRLRLTKKSRAFNRPAKHPIHAADQRSRK